MIINLISKLFIFIFLINLFFVNIFAYKSPGSPKGFVSDFTQTLNKDQVNSLNSRLEKFEKDTGAEVVFVIIESTGNETIEIYANKLFAEWGVGKRGQDNGLMVLVSKTERKVRVEVGYGLEDKIPDILASRIIKDMSSYLQNDSYFEAFNASFDTIEKILSGQLTKSQAEQDEFWSNVVTFFLIIVIVAVSYLINRNKRLVGVNDSNYWNRNYSNNNSSGYRGGGGRSGGGGASGSF